MKKRFRIFMFLVMVLTLVLPISSFAAESTIPQYKINDPYVYPVKPGMDEWLKLDDHVKKIEACQIPTDILSNMSTDALIETVLSYPLLPEMYAWDSPANGYNAIKSQFNGLKELSIRTDATEKLSNLKSSLSLSKGKATDDGIKELNLRQLQEGITWKQELQVTALMSTGYVTTPMASKVPVYFNRTWTDAGITYAQAQAEFANLLSIYPYAVKVTDSNPAFNCHSYAWYWQSSSNNCWMNNPSTYWNDGSYIKGSVRVNSKVCYFSSSTPIHSGVVYSYYSGFVGVESKWGALGIVRHSLNDNPYSYSSISYYN